MEDSSHEAEGDERSSRGATTDSRTTAGLQHAPISTISHSSSNTSSLAPDLKEATAAIVQAAVLNERSDSVLSRDTSMMEDDESSLRFSTSSLVPLSEEAFLERESVEATQQQQRQSLKLTMNHGRTLTSSHSGIRASFAESVTEFDSETPPTSIPSDLPATVREDPHRISTLTASSSSYRPVQEEEEHQLQLQIPDSLEGILEACGVLPLPLEHLQLLWKSSEEDLIASLRAARANEEYLPKNSGGFSSSIQPSLPPDSRPLLLFSIFGTFCQPPPSLQAIQQIFELEEKYVTAFNDERTTSVYSSRENIVLPQDVIISMSCNQASPIVQLLLQPQYLMALPKAFQLSFFRILIRLLTGETDEEYDNHTLRPHHNGSDMMDGNSDRDGGDSVGEQPAAESLSSSVDDLKRRTHDRVQRMRNKRESIDKHRRKEQSSIVDRLTQSSSNNGQSKHQIYTIVRFRCAWPLSDKSAVTVLLQLYNDLIKTRDAQQDEGEEHQHHLLMAPVMMLIGLVSSAGIAVHELRQLLHMTAAKVESGDISDRIVMIRALTTAAEGASQSTLLVGKASPRYFFTFSKSESGLKRTIKSLTNWPFRNDFGMAVWFRCESFNPNRPPKLLQIMSPDGSGIVISFESLENDNGAMTLVVSARDRESEEEHVVVRNCVLLPRVWYHLAIRHTRSRLKGVFSLSARQQVSLFLDGKLMLTEPLKFPTVELHEQDTPSNHSSTPSFLSGLQLGKSNTTSMTVEFGSSFEGQMGALYIFNDNISDASLGALYQVTAGTRSRLSKRDPLKSTKKQANKSGKSVMELNSVDADEIVMAKEQGKTPRLTKSMVSVIDLLGDGEEAEIEIPAELTKSGLGSKLFMVLDPARTVGSMVLELHAGAHVSMDSECVQPWYVDGAKNVVASIGGVQALIPLFDSLLSGSVEALWNSSTTATALKAKKSSQALVPSLLLMMASFLRSHGTNAREMMRCGGIEIATERLLHNKSLKCDSGSLVQALRSTPALASQLVDSLIELRLACEHYDPLERTVFGRLLFNTTLWFGDESKTASGVSLYLTLLPVLSSLARVAPDKVRDVIGVRALVELLPLYTDVGETKEDCTRFLREPATELFDRSSTSGLSADSPLTIQERRHVVDVILGMMAMMMHSTIDAVQLSPFIDYISYNADYEWEKASQESSEGRNPNLRIGMRQERYLATVKSCTILSTLLKGRPPVEDFFKSLETCCGGSQGVVSWMLCALANSFDDELRSIGIRCLADYLEIAAPKADTSLQGESLPTVDETSGADLMVMMRNNSARKLSTTFIGKTLSHAMANAPVISNTIVPPGKSITQEIVYKLLWHLLKCHRARISKKTHVALIYLLSEDRGRTDKSKDLIEALVVSDELLRSGWRLSLKSDEALLLDVKSVSGKRLRQTPATHMILRLLRFLPNVLKEAWLLDLVVMTKTCPTNIPILIENGDWQASLFHVVSDVLEEIHARFGLGESTPKESSDKDKEAESTAVQRTNDSPQDLAKLQVRFDLALKLYSTLLGYSFRSGAGKDLVVVEQTATLERVCVNGHDALSLILNYLLAELFENGTVDSVKPVNYSTDEPNWKLKESSRIVTDAILGPASSSKSGIDSAFAIKQWHALRHLAVVVSCVVTKSGFGMGELFESRPLNTDAFDPVSGGLYGIRISESKDDVVVGADYVKSISATSMTPEDAEYDRHRRISVRLSAQTLTILDAFIFPDSLDASLPVSQLHGLALVRSNESRVGTSQGPVLASLIRLSLVLLTNLEPSSVKLLQCCSRLRCFIHWSLELIRESIALAGYSAAFHDLTAPLDRLLLAIVLHCHRTLARCSSVLNGIESATLKKLFRNDEDKKRHDRRLLRVAFELREIVLTAYRGRNEVLRAALSCEAFEALQESLEKSKDGTQGRPSTKETIIRDFLQSKWVKGYHNNDMRGDTSVPSQVANGQTHLHKTSSHRGSLAIEELAAESRQIILDYNHSLNSAFKVYLDDQKNWVETDLVRDLEFDGDIAVKRLSADHVSGIESSRQAADDRAKAATSRWVAIQRHARELWDSAEQKWELARHPDCMSRRILLTRNRYYNNHEDASYELMLGLDRERAEREREERRKKKEAQEREKELLEVLKRNEAFVPYGVGDLEDDDDCQMDESLSAEHNESLQEEGNESSKNTVIPTDSSELVEKSEVPDAGLKEESDGDGWARTFVWADAESVVARFENIKVVTLRTITEGRLLLTSHGLYFHRTGNVINVMTKEVADLPTDNSLSERWRLSRLKEVHGRRFMLRPQAIELFFADGVELFLTFDGGSRERDRFYAKMRNSSKVPLLWSPKSLNPRTVFKKSKATQLWRKGKMSNFDYLMHLNKIAGRTFNDVTQYPVFPWVLSDYTSDTIDLSDSRVYRDLSKPVGALNADRLASLIERYNDLAAFGFAENERFLYGSHYSSPGLVLHFLLRQEPFTSMAIELQSGRFDVADRLFFDIAGCWKSCLTSTSDVKELIPELFTCPEVLMNTNKFPLGKTQAGRDISEVALPPWAKGSAHEFVRMHRLALESEFVSKNINQWIDLIFGFKQRGPAAQAAHNVFHYLSYEGAIDMDKITDEVERSATESHIQNFGQTPSQLLTTEPHPSRYASVDRWKPLLYKEHCAKHIRCYTPSKQFGSKQTSAAVVSLFPLSDALIAVYADMSLGTYRFVPSKSTKNPFSFKMEKFKTIGRNNLSRSRSAIKRGSALPATMDAAGNPHAVGNWSFALTVGGTAKETIRRKGNTSLLSSTADHIKEAEANSMLLSCGYWDDTVKCHSLDGLKLMSSDAGGHEGPIRCIATGIDGSLMVTGGEDATCRVWVVDHVDMAMALSDGYVQTALGSSNDGERLLTPCHVLWGHDHPVSCLDLSSDLDTVVSGDTSGLICVHTMRRGEFVRSFRPKNSSYGVAVRKIALENHGTFVSYTQDENLHACTINNQNLCSVMAEDSLNDMKLVSSGQFLVTGGDRGHVVFRSIHDLHILSVLDLSRYGPVQCLTMTPEELNPIPQFLFVGSQAGMITVISEDPEAKDASTVVFEK